MAIHRPWSNRTRRCVRDIRGWATRTSARRSRPITTSLPAAKVRSAPSYRTVSTGGAGWLITPTVSAGANRRASHRYVFDGKTAGNPPSMQHGDSDFPDDVPVADAVEQQQPTSDS